MKLYEILNKLRLNLREELILAIEAKFQKRIEELKKALPNIAQILFDEFKVEAIEKTFDTILEQKHFGTATELMLFENNKRVVRYRLESIAQIIHSEIIKAISKVFGEREEK